MLCPSESCGEDLTQLTNEDLVARAQQPDGQAARGEIERRYQPARARRIYWFARRCGLPGAEWDDLQQQGALATLEATAVFVPGRCRFETFLFRVVQLRVIDYVRRYRWRESYLDRSSPATEVLEVRRELVRVGLAVGVLDDDPVPEAERNEVWAGLEQAVLQLEGLEGRLWELWSCATKLAAIARGLEVSYGVARGMLAEEVPQLRRAAPRGTEDPAPAGTAPLSRPPHP
jgi:DNA-directed RNA polymerase specialized sigma24 family protein